eukprot:1315448-Amorphochlora_amoeboformis.AAC.1
MRAKAKLNHTDSLGSHTLALGVGCLDGQDVGCPDRQDVGMSWQSMCGGLQRFNLLAESNSSIGRIGVLTAKTWGVLVRVRVGVRVKG